MLVMALVRGRPYYERLASPPLRYVPDVVHIAIATDAAYLPWAATAVLSCLETNDPHAATFHLLLGADVTELDRDRLREVTTSRGASLEIHAIDERVLEQLPSKGADRGGRISWARIALPDLLPDLGRIIYLDADVFVRRPMAELWSADLGDAPIGAVANVVQPEMRPHVRSLGITDPAGYFNAGMLVIDLVRWREDNTSAALAQYAVEHFSNPWFDQDALNVVFGGRWCSLHPRWNAMNSLWGWPQWADDVFGVATAEEARADPAIVHFEGPLLAKPWHYLNDHPMRDEYRAAVRQTFWRDTPLEERTLLTWLIARLPRRHWADVYTRVHRARNRLG
jgi:lipopolysaccharide biosynthesis glycosyltransferase